MVFIALLCGCVPTPPSTSGQNTPAVKTEFTKAELLEDYDLLWERLYANYPYFPVLERRGIDVAEIRAQTRKTMETRVSDLEGFYQVLNSMFLRMEYFAHLSPVSPGLYQDYRYYAEREDGRAQWNDIVLAPQTVAAYGQLSGQASFSAEESQDGEPQAPLPTVKTDYFPEAKAAYFQLPSFNSKMLSPDADMVADYLAALSNVEVEHIIFDVTGNDGGDDRYWQNNIVSPFGGAYTLNQYVFAADTPLNRYFYSVAGPESYFQSLSAFPAEKPLPDFVEELGLTFFSAGILVLPDENYSGKTVRSTAKRWVLVDEVVFSASESFAIFCKDTGWATLVGKRTGGDGGGFSPVLLALKNTGLLVRFSSTVGVNGDGSLSAEYGTTPDIPCIKGESPLDACLRQIYWTE